MSRWWCLSLVLLTCTACSRLTAFQGPPADLRALAERPPEALPSEEALDHPAPPLTMTSAIHAVPAAAPDTPPPPPTLLPAEVYPVWVPDHLTDDATYVSGHWVWVLAAPARWPLPRIPTPATVRVPLPPGDWHAPDEATHAPSSRKSAPISRRVSRPGSAVTDSVVSPPTAGLPPGLSGLLTPGLLPPGGQTP